MKWRARCCCVVVFAAVADVVVVRDGATPNSSEIGVKVAGNEHVQARWCR